MPPTRRDPKQRFTETRFSCFGPGWEQVLNLLCQGMPALGQTLCNIMLDAFRFLYFGACAIFANDFCVFPARAYLLGVVHARAWPNICWVFCACLNFLGIWFGLGVCMCVPGLVLKTSEECLCLGESYLVSELGRICVGCLYYWVQD